MYYLVYGILYLFSLLPFRVLYLLSDGIAFLLYYIIGYRKQVVFQNLAIAFPEKSAVEIKKIAKRFYRDFVDNFIEFIKLLSISEKTLNKRFVCDYSPINDLYATGQNVQLHLGHFFNWELANLAYSANVNYPLVVVYMPISNKVLDRVFIKARKRFGSLLVRATRYRQDFSKYNRDRFALVLVGDQNPGGPENAYWADFFGKKTPFVKGPEKGARLNRAAVVMCNIYKLKRGYYKSEASLLTTDPRSLPDGEITRQMIAFIENNIRQHPSNYLWSHRRWKWEYIPEKYESLVI